MTEASAHRSDTAIDPDVQDHNIDTTKPFYLRDTATMDELEMQVGVLSPKLREDYGQVEDVVSQHFLALYGKYLNDEQNDYFKNRQILYTSHELADRFGQEWETGVESVDPDVSEIEGNVYLRYSLGGPVDEEASSRTTQGSTVRQYWAGRFALYPLGEDESFRVNKKWLMTQADFDAWGDSKKKTPDGSREVWASLGPFVYTAAVGDIAVHEKVHGIQDPELPLPVLEGAAHYYQLQVAQDSGWESDIQSNMDQFARLYQEFVEDVGDDAHLLVFGNIDDQAKKDLLLKKVKEKFSVAAIEEASRYDEYDWSPNPQRHIHWETVPKDEIKV